MKYNYCVGRTVHPGEVRHPCFPYQHTLQDDRMLIMEKYKTDQGYIRVKFLAHPNRNTNGYILEHRVVMEQCLGRYLTKAEVVHHENGNRSDNRIENLKLFKNKSEHRKYHIAHTQYYLDGYREYIIKRYNEGVGTWTIAREVKSHKSCVLKWMKKNGISTRPAKIRKECEAGYKWCNVCKEKLPIKLYYKNKNSTDGLRSRCIECTKKEVHDFYIRSKVCL